MEEEQNPTGADLGPPFISPRPARGGGNGHDDVVVDQRKSLSILGSETKRDNGMSGPELNYFNHRNMGGEV